MLLLQPSGGGKGQEMTISKSRPLKGMFEDGPVTLTGRGKLPKRTERRSLNDWMPDKGVLFARGEDINWSAPRQYRVTLDPDVKLEFAGLVTTKRPTLALRGKVELVDGAYFEDNSFFARTVDSASGRSDAWSQSITESVPQLAEMTLDLNVVGPSFLVQTDFGIGTTDLDAQINVRAAGTLDQPELHGTVDVTDGTITYSIVRREFEVTRGQLKFDGPVWNPLMDVEAETLFVATSGYDDGCRLKDEDTVVTVRVRGRVPEFEPTLSTNQACSQGDIQYLILTGASKREAQNRGSATGTLDVFSADISNLLDQLINAPFIELQVAPDTKGNALVDAVWRIRNVTLGVTGRRFDNATTYDARYRHKFDDDLQLEAIRRGADENRPSGRYEVQLKYTVPLD